MSLCPNPGMFKMSYFIVSICHLCHLFCSLQNPLHVMDVKHLWRVKQLHQVYTYNLNSKSEFGSIYNYFIYSSYLPQFQWQNHSHATRTLAVVEPVRMRLVRRFQRVTAVMVWEAAHTCRTMALVYHVHKVSSFMQQVECYYTMPGTQWPHTCCLHEQLTLMFTCIYYINLYSVPSATVY